jgi:hypothetical protein
MSNLILREWNGRTIRQREDGYISATDMCQACGKLFADWNRLKSTNDFLEAISNDMGIPISQLVEIKKGNTLEFEQGTWLHNFVALELSGWLLPSFKVQCIKWVNELLLKGFVSLDNAKIKPAKMSLSQIEWSWNQLVKSGEITQTEAVKGMFADASKHFPHMEDMLNRLNKIIESKPAIPPEQREESQAMYERMLSVCAKYADKHSRDFVYARDLVGDAILRRKDFLTKYCTKKAKQLNKPDIFTIWQEMHDLGMGIFNKSIGTFQPKK